MQRALPRFGIFMLMLIMLFFAFWVWTDAVNAQEATEEPTPIVVIPEPEPPPMVVVESDPVISWQSVAIIALSVIAGVAVYFAATSVPPGVVKLLLPSLEAGVEVLDDYAETTPTPLDDAAADELQRILDGFEERIDARIASALKEALAPPVPPQG